MSNRIVFIDSRVADYQTLIAALAAGVEWVLIEPDEDGIDTMLRFVQGRTDLAGIHIVSHGSEGILKLGSTQLDTSQITGYAERLATIGHSLSPEGDILLYGCDIGSGVNGLALVEALAAATGADVAASDDTTGNAAAGGDWALELSSGPVATDSPFVAERLAAWQGRLSSPKYVFGAQTDPNTGNELWISDGTAAGTALLKDINPGVSGSNPDSFYDLGMGKSVFWATDGTNGRELWITDGTAGGTSLLKDLNPGAADSIPAARNGYVYSGFTPLGNGKWVFALDGGSLWVTDATEAGTLSLGIAAANVYVPSPWLVPVANGSFLFYGSTSGNGVELWKTDGTPGGTQILKDINSGTSSSTIGGGGTGLTPISGGRFLFAASNGTTNGSELWVTDGTASGTVLLKDIYAGTTSSAPNLLATLGNGKVLLRATDASYGQELWVTDGTAAGTVLLKDINTGTAGSSLSFFAALGNGKVLLKATTTTQGIELWVTDGSAAGTTLLKDVYAGSTGSNPYLVKLLGNGKALFSATDATNGTELWITDGSAAGTVLLKDIHTGSSSSSPAVVPQNAGYGGYFLGFENGKVAFWAADASNGQELWVTDGTSAGTRLLLDATPGASGTTQVATTMAPTPLGDGRWLFDTRGMDNGTDSISYWVSDGTPEGTLLLKRFLAPETAPVFTRLGNGQFLLTGKDPLYGTEMWLTDGTPAGTQLIDDLTVTTLTAPGNFSALGNGRSVFVVTEGQVPATPEAPGQDKELWASDGTVEGTLLLKDFASDFLASPQLNFWSLPNGGSILMAASAMNENAELWISDGTSGGTSLLHDFGIVPSGPRGFFLLAANKILFAVNDATGSELWTTDGTAAGTVLLKDVDNTIQSANDILLLGNGSALFGAAGSSGDYELWITDGTAAGTSLFKDINPGSAMSNPGNFFSLGNGKTLFNATTATAGTELWITDGTAANTVLVKDINAGTANSSADSFIALGNGSAIFRASSSSPTNYGKEWWVTDGTGAGTFILKDIYAGSSSSTTTPVVAFSLGNGKAVFSAFDATYGKEFWVTDGTAAGTQLLKDIAPGTSSSSPGTNGSLADFLKLGNGKAVFAATDATTGTELWVTDGTTAGTLQLADINAGSGSSLPKGFLDLGGGKVVFMANYTPWVTDGTSAGTTQLASTFSSGQLQALGNGKAVLVAGNQLWVTDGTGAGTTVVNSGELATLAVNQAVRFSDGVALLTTTSGELWISDGTTAGTHALKDVVDSSQSSWIVSGTLIAAPELDISGNGVAIASGDASPSAVDGTDLGEVATNSATASASFTLKNNGTATLNLGAASITGTHAGDFSIVAQAPATLAAGASTIMQVVFDPSALGSREATLTIASNDADEASYSFALHGVGIAINSAPTGTVSIVGTALQGQTLTATHTLADADGLGTVSYQWQADGSDMAGASGSSLTLTQAEVGKSITVIASYTDGQGAVESVASSASGAVANLNDAPTLAHATVDQTAFTGQMYSLTLPANGFADIDSGDTLTWSATLADGSNLPAWLSFNGTTRTLTGTPTSGNAGSIDVRITVTDGAGATAEDIFTLTTTIVPLNGTSGNDAITAGSGNDILYGLGGDDLLDGGAGADAMFGGAGSDTYAVDDAGDSVTEGQPVGTLRVSQGAAASQGNGGSQNAQVSADGRFVAFDSAADNLVAGDTNGALDVFVRDMLTGSTALISTNAASVQGNGGSAYARISGDGRYVAFESAADNLVSGDSGTTKDVFVKDMQTGAIALASAAADGTQGNAESRLAQISADGRYVVFESSASNLIAGDTNGIKDIFLKDMQTGSVILVSADVNGIQGNAGSNGAQVSADGRYVAFYGMASNLVPGDTNSADVFFKDLQTGAIRRLSESPDGTGGNSLSLYPQVSANGRFVVFESFANNLVAADSNGTADIFLSDTQTGSLTRISTDANGMEASGISLKASISADGRFVAFHSTASNLVVGDTNASEDIFVKDVQTGAIARVSTDMAGMQGGGASINAQVSDDGRFVVFQSAADNLADGDTNGVEDIFRVANPLIDDGAIDTVSSSVSLTLPDAVENLTLTGSDNIDGFGNALANVLAGNAGANQLAGGTGNDTLEGAAGNDRLIGGAGDDIFRFAAASGQDWIDDFNDGNDRIVVQGTILVAVGAGDGSDVSAGNVQIDVTGGVTTIFVGIDSTPGADLVVALAGEFPLDQWRIDDGELAANHLPAGALTIGGIAAQGETLTATSTLIDPDGETGALAYQWQANGIDIAGATTNSLILGQAEVGKFITVVASYTDALGTAESVTSASTSAVVNFNDAPALANYIADQNAAEGSAFDFTIPSDTFSDADPGEILTCAAQLSDGTALPAWLSFDTATRHFTGTPSNGDVGILVVRVTATDGANASISDDFVITIVNTNDPPVLGVPPALTFTDTAADDSFATASGNLVGSDVDLGTTLAYGISGGSILSGVSTLSGVYGTLIVDVTTGAWSFTPNDAAIEALHFDTTETFEFTLSDGTAVVSSTLTVDIAGTDEIVLAGIGFSNDTYTGSGNDSIVYSAATQPIVADLATGSASGGDIGNDTLIGFDNIVGGSADDILVGNDQSNSLNGGAGNDTLLGLGDADTLLGGSGNDRLDGGLGIDRMEGGNGNDFYVVDHRLDQVVELATDGGIDSVSARLTHTLADNVENLFLTGSVTLRSGGFFGRKTTTLNLNSDGTGNDADNLLRGNGGHNELAGLGGNDTLLGGAGADVLRGGSGADKLLGGAGADTFVFAAGDGGPGLAAADLLYDFEDGIDTIALAGGLGFADLAISQGNGSDTAAGNTVIRTGSGDYLAVLLNVSAGSITTADFQTPVA